MKKNRTKRPRYRLLKAGCVGAGLLSISNPTQVTAADIGILDVHNFSAPPVSLGTILNPFPNSSLGVYVAAGDLDGDGLVDIVVGPGRGEASVAVALATGGKHDMKCEIYSLANTPHKGVRVATGDLTGDGHADIIVTPAIGRGSQAAAYKAQPLLGGSKVSLEPIGSNDGIFDGFAGGVSVAVGDFEDDGVPDIVAAKAGDHGWNIKKNSKVLAKFNPYEPPLPSGVGGLEVAMGDIDGDGEDEVIVLPVQSQGGSLATPMLQYGKEKWIEIQGWDWEIEVDGVHIAMGDLDGDGMAELVAGSPRGMEPHLKVYSIEESPVLPGGYMAFMKMDMVPYAPDFMGGVRVAVGDVNGDGFGDIVFGPAAIPEPATIGSLLVGVATWLLGGRRRRRDGSPPG